MSEATYSFADTIETIVEHTKHVSILLEEQLGHVLDFHRGTVNDDKRSSTFTITHEHLDTIMWLAGQVTERTRFLSTAVLDQHNAEVAAERAREAGR